jgi:NitT/TauT family transport system substrate-binding protein
MRPRATVLLPVLLALLGAVAGCSPAPTEPLRVASSPWPGYEPIYLARDLGYLDPERVVCFELPSSGVGYEAFRNGSADVATMTLNRFLELLHGGVQARAVSVLDYSFGADAAMAVPAVRTLADLKGRRVAVGSFAVGGGMLLTRMLELAGLTREQVIVEVIPEDQHEIAYRQGRIDVFMTYEPFKGRLAALGAHSIFDSRSLPRQIVDLMVVREEAFQSRPDDVCELVRQRQRAADYLRRQPGDGNARVARRLGMPPQDFARMLDGLVLPSAEENLHMLAGAQPELVEHAQRVDELMASFEHWQQPVDVRGHLFPGIGACLP